MIKFKKGDTLIEVMLAVSVFGVIMMGGLTLMNQGVSKTQHTLQLTMARNLMDSQAEALRYINASYLAAHPNINAGTVADIWRQVKTLSKSSATDLSTCPTDSRSYPNNSFVINSRNMAILTSGGTSLTPATTYPRMIFNKATDANQINRSENVGFAEAQGVWIEAIKGDKFYDFHIRACWRGNSSAAPTTLGTIVRLYDMQ